MDQNKNSDVRSGSSEEARKATGDDLAWLAKDDNACPPGERLRSSYASGVVKTWSCFPGN